MPGVVDVHTHCVPAALAEALRRRRVAPCIVGDGSGERFVMPHGTLAFGPEYVDMNARIAFMDAHGIALQLLSFPGLFGLDSLPARESLPLVRLFNDAVSGFVRDHPGRFAALAALPLADPDRAVSEYRRAREELGLSGAILPVNAILTRAHAERMRPLFVAARELGGHLFVHPGRRPDEVPNGAAQPPSVAPDCVAERQALAVQHAVAQCMVTLLYSDFLDPFGDVSLHVANLGGTLPAVVERMDNVSRTRFPGADLPSARLGRLHVDISSLGPRTIELAAAFFGSDRLLFGSDCPIFSSRASLDAVRDACLDDAARAAILAGNARRLLAGLTA